MQIKFLSINLYEGGLLFNNILDFLNKEKPDILTLQEVYNGKNKKLASNYRSIEILQNNLKDFYHYFSPELQDNLPMGKIDMGAERKGDYSTDPKNMQYVQLHLYTTMLNVFNLHGIWGFDGKDNLRRLEMGRIVDISDHLPLVCTLKI